MSQHTPIARLYPVLEHPIVECEPSPATGASLARVIEAVPALSPLLDFHTPDPKEIAVEVGMVHPREEDGLADLEEIDFGPDDWFEPSVGLMAVQNALNTLKADPRAISNAIYDPQLKPADVISDLKDIQQTLLLAQQHETRFHFALEK